MDPRILVACLAVFASTGMLAIREQGAPFRSSPFSPSRHVGAAQDAASNGTACLQGCVDRWP